MIETVSAERIHREIADAVNGGSTYIDSLLEYAERTGMEVELLGEIVKKSGLLFERVKIESIKNNILKPDSGQGITDEWFRY